jgi:hypothetical protein
MVSQQAYMSEANPRSLLSLDANINAAMVRETCLRMKAAEYEQNNRPSHAPTAANDEWIDQQIANQARARAAAGGN